MIPLYAEEAAMSFEFSPKSKDFQQRLLTFMDEHIYPNEARFHEEIEKNRWKPTRIIEELKPKARAAGLWNMADYAPPEVDTLLAQGEATSNPAQRFAVYSKLFQRLQADEPYVGLYQSVSTGAISPKFKWPDYSPWWWDEAYTLGIRPAA